MDCQQSGAEKNSKMSGSQIKCPNCGAEIAVSEALASRTRTDLESSIRKESGPRARMAVEAAETHGRSLRRAQRQGSKR